jgi:hypothetical protein
MVGCVDINNGLFQFFFGNSTTITAFNPSTSCVIDLASIGVGIIKNGSTYYTSITLLGISSFLFGFAYLSGNFTPLPCYTIVNDYNVNYI